MTQRCTRRLRVLVDANLLVSALLSNDSVRSAAAATVDAAREGLFMLLVPRQALEETARVIAEKPLLAARVSPQEVVAFIDGISSEADIMPRITQPIPQFTRDPGGDYLIAHAILAGADYVVTRDKDLLDLQRVETIGLVSPNEFL